MKYPIPANEEQRLRQLKEYQVLDSLPESQFDDIAKLASIICEVPITMISLIDENRQWFKSKVGLDIDETEREVSFCQYAIMDDDVFEVSNAVNDERFMENPFVAGDPKIRFYAGAPLRTPGGFNVGTLCVIDTKPKKLTEAQREALAMLSKQVVANLELRRERNSIDSERKMAVDAGALLNTFLENSPSMINMRDREGRFIYANRNTLEYLGKDLTAILGRTSSELFPSQVASQAERENEEVMATGQRRTQEYTLREGGIDKHYLRHVFPLRDDKGVINGVGAISEDITESRRLERELKISNDRFSSLFYNSPISMVIADATTASFIRVNKAFLETFGYEESEVLGKSVNDLNYIADPRQRTMLGKELQEKGFVRNREFFLRKKNGEGFTALCSMDLVRADGQMQVVSAFQDITERKKMEDALREATKEAEAAANVKSSFLANMSHEIRTPLNAMLGFADMISCSALNDQQRDYISAIESSGQNLLTIINDILDFSKIEAGMLTLEEIPFSPREALNSIATMFLGKAEEKGIRLHTLVDPQTPEVVNGDQTRFSQVLINLIGNAVKFTQRGSVTTECSVVGINNGRVTLRVSVKDTGIGIASDKLELIFDRFTQADVNTTRTFGGTGLGLSIAKRLVELQGGNINVDSVTGAGSEFYFTISYDIADSSSYVVTKAAALVKDEDLRGKKILIAEDNPLNQKLATIILNDCGIFTEIAHNGQEACEMLTKEDFDMVLMDIQMPVLDGYAATRKIRQEMHLKMPIIAMTANALPGERERCIHAGMDDYITKPFKPQVLLNVVSSFLGKQTAHRTEQASDTESGRMIDLRNLEEFSVGNPAFMRELIEIFLRQNPKDMADLRRSIELHDYARVKSVAHTLHSSLGVLGFPQTVLTDLRAIEELAKKQKDPEVMLAKAETIMKQCERGCRELEEALKQI